MSPGRRQDVISTSSGMSRVFCSFFRQRLRSSRAFDSSRSVEKRSRAVPGCDGAKRRRCRRRDSAEMSTFIDSRWRSSSRTTSPLIGPALVLGKQDRRFRADPRARRAVRLAVVLLLHRDLLGAIDAVDVEQAEGQALHAVGAAVVVDHREPRLPSLLAAGLRNRRTLTFRHRAEHVIGASARRPVDEGLSVATLGLGARAPCGRLSVELPEHQMIRTIARRRPRTLEGEGRVTGCGHLSSSATRSNSKRLIIGQRPASCHALRRARPAQAFFRESSACRSSCSPPLPASAALFSRPGRRLPSAASSSRMFSTSTSPVGEWRYRPRGTTSFTARGKHAAITGRRPRHASRASAGSLRADISHRSATASNATSRFAQTQPARHVLARPRARPWRTCSGSTRMRSSPSVVHRDRCSRDRSLVCLYGDAVRRRRACDGRRCSSC